MQSVGKVKISQITLFKLKYLVLPLTVVPRVLFEKWTGQDFSKLLSHIDEFKSFIKTLIEGAEKYRFDGYVLEVWSLIATAIPFDPLTNFIRRIGNDLFLISFHCS